MAEIPWDQIENEYKRQTKPKKWDADEVMDKIRRLDFQSALPDLKKAVEEHPSNEKLINLYVHCLRKNSHSIMDIQSAKILLENFTKSQKAGDLTSFNLGTLYMDLEQYEEALKQFEKVLVTDPSNSKLLYNIALCHHYSLREDKALSYYEQAIKLGNKMKKALLNYSVLLSKLDRKQEAKAYLDELQKLYGEDGKVLNNINVLLASEDGDKSTIRKNFDLINKNNAQSSTSTYNEGVFEYYESNLETSAKLFQQVDGETVDSDPLRVFARLNCAQVFERLNKTKEARRFYLKIIDHLGRFIDVSDIQQRMADLLNPGSMPLQPGQRRKKGGRSNLIAYDANLMEFNNNFSMVDPGMVREYSSMSQSSPKSRPNRRQSNDLDSPLFFNKSVMETSRVNHLENMKGGDDEEDKQVLDSPIKNSDSSFEKSRKPSSPKETKNTQPEENQNTETDSDTWTKETCLEKIRLDSQNYEAHLRLGLISLEEKTYSEAIEHFQKCLTLQPVEEQARTIKGLVDCYIYSGDFEKALTAVEDLLKTKSEKVEYLMRKGLAFEGLGNVKEAKTLLTQATKEAPNNSLTHLRLGALLVRQEKLEEGIASLRKATEINPSSFETRIKLAEALIMGGDEYLNEALKHFKYVYDLDRNDYDALIGLSQVYEKRGDTQLAIEYAESASKLSEAPTNCLYFLGTLYYKSKDLKKAEDLFRRVLKKEIGHVGATIELATILVVSKDFEKAKKYFKHALKLDPDNVTANMRFGKILQSHFAEYDEAIECYRRVIAVDETQYKAHYQIGLVYTEQKMYNEAHKAFKACIDVNSKYGPAWRGVGQILFDNDKVQEALKHFQKALEVDGSDVEAMTQIGNCYYEMQDFDAAISWYEKILKTEKSANTLYNLGNCYFMKEGYEKAVEYYHQSIELDGTRAECFYNLGNSFVIMQNYEKAIEPFKRSCALDSQNVAAFYNLGNAYLLTKDVQNAKKTFGEVTKIEPNNIEWRYRIAYALDDNGDMDSAFDIVEESLKIKADYGELLFLKAQILEKKNKYEEAIKVLQSIKESQVGEQNVAEKIEALRGKSK